MVSAIPARHKLMAVLQPDLRMYRPTDVVAFRKTRDAFGGLSNMAAGYPVNVAGIKINTVEALYQACRFPHLPDVQELIIQQASPMTAKMRSKPYRSNSRPDWEEVRIPIMKWCLRVKLAQNWHEFGEVLLETGTRPIVEDSSKDDFWGAMRDDAGVLRGRNVLGRLLMELRERLREDADSLKIVKPLPIPQFLLLSRQIPEIQARAWLIHADEQPADLLDLVPPLAAAPVKPEPIASSVNPVDVGLPPNLHASPQRSKAVRTREKWVLWTALLGASALVLAALVWLQAD